MADWAYVAVGFVAFAGASGVYVLGVERGIRRLRPRRDAVRRNP